MHAFMCAGVCICAASISFQITHIEENWTSRDASVSHSSQTQMVYGSTYTTTVLSRYSKAK